MRCIRFEQGRKLKFHIEEGSSRFKFYEDPTLATTLHKDETFFGWRNVKGCVMFPYVFCFYESAKNDEFCKSSNVYV